ncbi:hypothetical protein HYU90_01425 [Candidatus Collierbacteria bacterium]|nr:hypothetical protein [Candidatus Collierbacteria bacterium]
MKSKSLRHLSHYIVLLVLMIVGLIGASLTGRNTGFHPLILAALALIYFVWGVVHSALEGELHPEIVFEYFLFASLGFALVLGVLYYL